MLPGKDNDRPFHHHHRTVDDDSDNDGLFFLDLVLWHWNVSGMPLNEKTTETQAVGLSRTMTILWGFLAWTLKDLTSGKNVGKAVKCT